MGEGSDRVELHGATPCWERYPDAVLAPLSSGYRRREPEKTLLYEVVEQNLPAFLAETMEKSPNGEGLPWFVEREFRNYLDCGILSRGFCRAVCPKCGHEIIVGLSCKGRGCCPSCTTRRMLDTAAHLVDRLLPVVPYRQWVLAFPRSLRLRLGYEKAFFVAARRIVLAAIFTWQRRAARRHGIAEPLVGAVSFAQRFASNLSLHPHLHLVVPDGVFFEADGRVLFRALPKPRACRGADRATSPKVDRATRAFGRALRRARAQLFIGRSSSTESRLRFPTASAPKARRARRGLLSRGRPACPPARSRRP